ncbi:MAG: hypothetical protein HN961_02710, partial [Planctomycetes bacterium]|nr:hypothetical protein [Planctomycetota bacterium]
MKTEPNAKTTDSENSSDSAARMSFGGHLDELRKRVVRGVLALGVLFIVA